MGEVLQIRDYQNRKELDRILTDLADASQHLDAMMFNMALATYDIATDTAPSELNPDKEPA